jgi:arsenical pump membrane protein
VSAAVALILALVLLGLTLATAVIRPKRVPDAAVALFGAVLVVGAGALSWDQATDAVRQLGPTVGFLATWVPT